MRDKNKIYFQKNHVPAQDYFYLLWQLDNYNSFVIDKHHKIKQLINTNAIVNFQFSTTFYNSIPAFNHWINIIQLAPWPIQVERPDPNPIRIEIRTRAWASLSGIARA